MTMCSEGVSPWIETSSGQEFHYLAIDVDDICIEDIAHALAHTCRFGGHTSEFYSVAQHSVLAAQLVAERYRDWALMHDSPETYIGDIPKPLKNLILIDIPDVCNEGKPMPISVYEHVLMGKIAHKYGLEKPYAGVPDPVHNVDMILLKAESKRFMVSEGYTVDYIRSAAGLELPEYPSPIIAWHPEYAKKMFLRYAERYLKGL